jgi:hypothetical protein
MKFVVVNDRMPREQACCALCRRPIADGYVRDIATRLAYCRPRCYADRRLAFVRQRQQRASVS